ncbi:MAG: phage head-tail joining protein [Cognaticolwellia aestuarii]
MTDKIDEQLSDIDEVISGGEKRIKKGDRELEYRSLDELERIEQRLQQKKTNRRPILSVTTSVNRGI